LLHGGESRQLQIKYEMSFDECWADAVIRLSALYTSMLLYYFTGRLFV
jgi:hypothetical protein